MSVSTHHEQIGIAACTISLKRRTDVPPGRIRGVDRHLNTMMRQVLCKLDSRAIRINLLFIGDGHHIDPLRLLQERDGIGHRPRGGLAEIPGDDRRIQLERHTSLPFIRDDQRRPARAEDDRFRIPLIEVVALRNRQNRQITKARICRQRLRNVEEKLRSEIVSALRPRFLACSLKTPRRCAAFAALF